jgi:CBS domain-containing protein
MARKVAEIMNREVFGVRRDDTAQTALDGLLALGISGAPVLDEEGRPVGMVSLRRLAERRAADRAADRMTSAVPLVSPDATIVEAGRRLASGSHRLVVVDEQGRAVGVVSALDVVRGLLGVPATHPAAFPHLDTAGLTWTDELPFEPDSIEVAPDGPGVFALLHGGAGWPERIVWAEASENVYARLMDILSTPQEAQPLKWWLERPPLRFRAAAVPDISARRQALEALMPHERMSVPRAGPAP